MKWSIQLVVRPAKQFHIKSPCNQICSSEIGVADANLARIGQRFNLQSHEQVRVGWCWIGIIYRVAHRGNLSSEGYLQSCQLRWAV